MQKILKYPITIVDSQIVSVPRGFKPLSVQMEFGNGLYLWVQAESEAPLVSVIIRMFGTEHLPMEGVDDIDIGEFLGSIHAMNGPQVYHVYYRVVGE